MSHDLDFVLWKSRRTWSAIGPQRLEAEKRSGVGVARLKVVPFPFLLLDSLEMTPAKATTGAGSPRIGRAVDAALEAPLFHGGHTSTVLQKHCGHTSTVAVRARAG